MAMLIGVLLAVSVGLMATGVGLDRERSFYPVVTIVVASYYVLFAAMGGSTRALVLEGMVGLAFTAAAAWGFKRSLRVVAVALAAHGLFDLIHGEFIDNPGMPRWWPGFCLAYDVTAATYLAWLLRIGRVRSAAGVIGGAW